MPFKTEEHRSKCDNTLVAQKGSSDKFSHHRLEGGAFWRPPRELAPMPTACAKGLRKVCKEVVRNKGAATHG